MQVILLERVAKLGQMGDVVDVKPGYARNFLLPKGKAVFASEENIKIFEDKKTQLEGDNIKRKKEAETLVKSINFKEIIVIRAASESGQLYGSVSAKDIAQEITSSGLSVNKSQVILNKTLKSYLFAIIGAEYILNWLPIGTHDWFKFVEPQKLETICQKNSLKLNEVKGLGYNMLEDEWKMNNNTDVNYISLYKKI